MTGARKSLLFLIIALSACSRGAESKAVAHDLPEELSDSFDICLASMDGIDQAINAAIKLGWSIKDNRDETQYGVPQFHRQSAHATRKYPGERESGGRGQRLTFGVSKYPVSRVFYCNELKFRNEEFEDYSSFYEKISALDFIQGEAKTYDDCPRERCKGRISARWNFSHNGDLIWLTSDLDDSTFNLTFQRFEID